MRHIPHDASLAHRILYSFPVKITLITAAGILAMSILHLRGFIKLLPRRRHS